MTKDEKDYPDYMQYNIGQFQGHQFIMGFLLAVFTIVLTQLPDPHALHSQLALFFFSFLLNLYTFLAFVWSMQSLYYCKKVPPLSKHIKALATLSFLAGELIFGVTPVLLALWNLPNLAIASGISSLFLAIAIFIFVVRPYYNWRKTVS